MDLKQFIYELIKNPKIYKLNGNYSEWLKNCEKLKEDLPTVLPSFAGNPINSYYFVECLNKYTKYNHIFVNDAGSANYICSQGLKLHEGQREITSGAFYSMGCAIPFAIGNALLNLKLKLLLSLVMVLLNLIFKN